VSGVPTGMRRVRIRRVLRESHSGYEHSGACNV
jgi:hypothetical protein